MRRYKEIKTIFVLNFDMNKANFDITVEHVCKCLLKKKNEQQRTF